MFSSNQVFSISGDDDYNLKIALETALKLHSHNGNINPNQTGIKSYKKDHVGRLVFSGKVDAEGYTPYSMNVSLDMAVELIKDYLRLSDPDDFGAYPMGDGEVNNGWKLVMPVCENSDDRYYAIIAVEPCFIFYHK